jgi:hypothetical protein
MSVTFASNMGSLETLKLRVRCGFSPFGGKSIHWVDF